MSIRVHELAKELGLTSKGLMEKLKKAGVSAKGHMSVLDAKVVAALRKKPRASSPKKERAKKKERPKAAPRQKAAGVKEKPLPVEKAPVEKAPAEKAEPKPAERAPEPPRVKPQPQEVKKPAEIKEAPKAPPMKSMEVGGRLTVKQLSARLDVKHNDLIKTLMKRGIFATLNQNLGADTISDIAREYGYEIKNAPTLEEELLKEHKDAERHEAKRGSMMRAPIVTMMGHVDHGKTSLLDYIRKTKVASKEKGGITQHIGAYEVGLGIKGKVTFLDTPGHQAFTAMRARGASATDIVVLVVAADDGVMPQTVEAIDHAKAANAPIVVAINKCDLPNISLDKVKKGLAKHGLMPEDWGGKTITIPVSAKTGEGVDKLLEMLILEAELLELAANPGVHARGVVVEGKLSPGQGPVATVLVKNGTLKVGDIVLTGLLYGRVKAMINDRGKRITEAPPSTPVEILGLSGVSVAGDEFFVVKDEKKARTLSLLKQEEKRVGKLRGSQRLSLEDIHKRIQDGSIKELKVIVKGDVQGSIEALKASLEELSTKEVKLNVTHMGTGNINESDVMLALVSGAIVLGFHVKVEPRAEEIAKNEMVEVKLYNIIYEAVGDLKAALEGLLEPIEKEIFLGRARVQQVFRVSKVGTVAGCLVTKGTIPRSANVKLIRSKEVIFKGKIRSLKHVKDDIKEAGDGHECGISLGGHDDIKAGDLIEAFRIEKIMRRLEG